MDVNVSLTPIFKIISFFRIRKNSMSRSRALNISRSIDPTFRLTAKLAVLTEIEKKKTLFVSVNFSSFYIKCKK